MTSHETIAQERSFLKQRIETIRGRIGERTIVTVRRVTCVCCGANEEIKCDPRYPVEFIKRMFLNKGWSFGRRLRCPSCARPFRSLDVGAIVKAKREGLRLTVREFAEGCGVPFARIGEIETGKRLPTSDQLEKINAFIEKQKSNEEKSSHIDADVIPNFRDISVPTTAEKGDVMEKVREPTLAETGLISRCLEECFDSGRYLDGMSDKKVAEKLNLPWAVVSKVREVLRGPLKESKEVMDLRSRVSSLEDLFKTEMASIKKLMDGLAMK